MIGPIFESWITGCRRYTPFHQNWAVSLILTFYSWILILSLAYTAEKFPLPGAKGNPTPGAEGIHLYGAIITFLLLLLAYALPRWRESLYEWKPMSKGTWLFFFIYILGAYISTVKAASPDVYLLVAVPEGLLATTIYEVYSRPLIPSDGIRNRPHGERILDRWWQFTQITVTTALVVGLGAIFQGYLQRFNAFILLGIFVAPPLGGIGILLLYYGWKTRAVETELEDLHLSHQRWN